MNNGDQKVSVTGGIQPQVHIQNAKGDQSKDDVLMRRLYAQIDVTVSRNWSGTPSRNIARW